MNRREFLKTAGAFGAFNIIPARVLWGATAPSNQITRAIIGLGEISMSGNHLPFGGSRLVGVTDCYQPRIAKALAWAEKNGKGKISVTLSGHPSVAEQSKVPMEFYVQEGTP